ncbi:hypothetical protein AYL99_05850 [Fonsecaea erecta]|uniref:N-acetyltransferase domain-containing protein n=1 Tax=Fonsecaea erecta TaxID=1367422 RepID=A0A178ZM11_9EURO|nr:hypothetical protein AYL99_05850 [Fonsecaea erecta]OAP60848.1 hypothetical protein AYL99_05850 [Fonsecaea erecta]
MHLVLSRLEPQDLDAIVPMMFESFRKIDLANVFFGRKSPASYAYSKRTLLDGLQNDPADVFLKIEDLDAEVNVDVLDEQGHAVATERRRRIVCASNWKIFPTYVTPKEQQDRAKNNERQTSGEAGTTTKEESQKEAAFSYLETEQERADAAFLMEDFLTRRRRECTEGHVLCFLLFTDPDYQGKGCGRMMMQWGNDVADALMLPCWIEASPEGELLYKQMGYEGRERVKIQTKHFLSEYLHMRRPATVGRVRLEGKTTPFAFLRGRATWTCPRCKNLQNPFDKPRRGFTSSRRPVRVVRPRQAVYWAAAGGSAGASLLLFGDDIKHGWLAAERTGRVVTTLAVCINDYRVTLNEQHDDPEEHNRSLKACHKRCADRTLKAMEANGSIFIKLGQHISSMGYLLPTEYTETFVPLQDKCPVSSYESIEEMYLKDTGHRIEDHFDDFTKDPIGAASLAQVHLAVMKDTGQRVAVKVQHPSLEEWVPLDLALTRFTFRTLKRAFPDYDLEWLSNEMDFSLPQELDFRLEGQNAMYAKQYFERHTRFPLVIPQVISANKRILVMDYVMGARVDNLPYFKEHNISRAEVSATLARIFNVMIFSKGAPLHCDPHAGNIAIRHNPKRRYPYNFDVILYDHGLYRMPDDKLRRDYAKLWLAVIDADEAKMRKYAYEVAGIGDKEFPLFASAITGRDYRVLTRKEITTSVRDDVEKENIGEVFGQDLLAQLVQLLGHVPRIILLILKTNDLTRSLDEALGSTQPMRPMLILAKYASWTVWQNEKDMIRRRGSFLRPQNFWRLLRAWVSFMRVELKLFGYERYLSIRRHLGLDE